MLNFPHFWPHMSILCSYSIQLWLFVAIPVLPAAINYAAMLALHDIPMKSHTKKKFNKMNDNTLFIFKRDN